MLSEMFGNRHLCYHVDEREFIREINIFQEYVTRIKLGPAWQNQY